MVGHKPSFLTQRSLLLQVPAIILAVLLFATVKQVIAGIPATNDVYGLLNRAWLYGATGQPPPGTRPENIHELLRRIQDVDQHRDRLPAAEQDELDEVLAGLAVYAQADSLLPDSTRWSTFTGGRGVLFQPGSHFYSLNRDDVTVTFDPIIAWALIYDGEYNDRPLARSVTGFEVHATLGKSWSAGVRFRDTAEYMQNEEKGPYTRDAGYVAAVSPVTSGSSFDETQAYLEYHSRYLDAGIGRDRLVYGPSYDHGLLLSGQAPSFLYLQLRARIRPYLTFDWFHGRLDPAPLPDDTLYHAESGKWRRVVNQKWVAGHRLEWTPAWWLALGFSETVIYGERDPELGYIIPLNFYWSENHHQDRDDNVAWGIDLRLQPMDGLSVYFEGLLDETSLSGLLSSRLHNRTGWLAGIEAVEPFGLRSSVFNAEYVRLRPFVYSHWFTVGVYSHSGQSLGAPVPPNGDMLTLSLTKRVNAKWTWSLEAGRQRHAITPPGEDPIGGSIFELVPVGKRDDAYPFLAGEEITVWHGEATATWEPLERLILRAIAGTRNVDGEAYSLLMVEFAYNL